MKKIKTFVIILLEFSSFVILVLLFAGSLWNNRVEDYLFSDWPKERRESVFTAEKEEAYYQLVEKIGRGEAQFESLFDLLGGSILVKRSPMLSKIQTPYDLYYYSDPSADTPGLVIPKGTTIYFEYNKEALHTEYGRPLAYEAWGYGLYSFPTRYKGWRLAIPFLSDEQETITAPMYIKLKDLEKLQKFRYHYDTEQIEGVGSYHQLMLQLADYNKQPLCFSMKMFLLYFDRWLAATDSVRVLSKDLLMPGLPLWSVITLSGIYLITNILLIVRKGIRSRHAAAQ